MRLACVLLAFLLANAALLGQPPAQEKIMLVIHGGAGSAEPGKISPALEKQYRAELENALRAGQKVLQKDGSSLDAVEAAIKVLEDAPLFNAGKGAVFNREGRNELNAAIMSGKDKTAGAVAGVCRIKNPIAAARAVMEQSPHVLLIGEGAERFARDHKLEMVSPLYFWTEKAWNDMKKAEAAAQSDKQSSAAALPTLHFGTVGAVALDRAGNLAAGTSTGGLTYVYPGRVGDSPLIGAGTYADNDTCGVSCTGIGELFIRNTVAADIAARMRYKRDPLQKAVRDALDGLPKVDGGVGGIIALDRAGNVAMEYNTSCMYRGTITLNGEPTVAIFKK